MRYTKAQMLRDMETASAFHRMPFRVVKTHMENTKLKARGDFVPVCQYGRGMSMVAVKGELGCTDGTRFKSATRSGRL